MRRVVGGCASICQERNEGCLSPRAARVLMWIWTPPQEQAAHRAQPLGKGLLAFAVISRAPGAPARTTSARQGRSRLRGRAPERRHDLRQAARAQHRISIRPIVPAAGPAQGPVLHVVQDLRESCSLVHRSQLPGRCPHQWYQASRGGFRQCRKQLTYQASTGWLRKRAWLSTAFSPGPDRLRT
jgi:hypothetical protein